jgi:hypothetical protein
MPVRTDVIRDGSKPLSRTSCAFNASPVTTSREVARWYSQRVDHELLTGVETWRVRTTGALRESVAAATRRATRRSSCAC